VPGFAFAWAISAWTDLRSASGATTSTFGWPPSGTISTNSFAVS
jgi:hypothetical protein